MPTLDATITTALGIGVKTEAVASPSVPAVGIVVVEQSRRRTRTEDLVDRVDYTEAAQQEE